MAFTVIAHQLSDSFGYILVQKLPVQFDDFCSGRPAWKDTVVIPIE